MTADLASAPLGPPVDIRSAEPEIPSRPPTSAAVSGPVLVALRGMDRGVEIRVEGPVTCAGRTAVNDIVLDDVMVSRRHAELRRDGDVVTLVDLGSLNGTYLNREPFSGPVVLTHGDEIQIGKARLLFLHP